MKRNKEVSNKTVKYLRQQNKFGTDENQNGSSSSSSSSSSLSSSNQKVGTNLDFKLSKSNDHDSYTSPSTTEHNDDCNVGAANLPSAKEHKQNDETRSHSGKVCKLI